MVILSLVANNTTLATVVGTNDARINDILTRYLKSVYENVRKENGEIRYDIDNMPPPLKAQLFLDTIRNHVVEVSDHYKYQNELRTVVKTNEDWE